MTKFVFDATPEMARHIIRYFDATVGVKNLPENIRSIAKMHDDLPMDLKIRHDRQKECLQFMDDFIGRILLLDHNGHTGREVPLLWTQWRERFPIYLLTSTRSTARWMNLVKNFFPDKKVVILGNFREKFVNLNNDPYFKSEIDEKGDIYICDIDDYCTCNLTQKERPGLIIVEQAADSYFSVGNTLKDIMWENYSVCCILSLHTMSKISSKTDGEIYRSIKWESGSCSILNFIREYILLYSNFSNMCVNQKQISSMMIANGYTKINYEKLAVLCGMSNHMIKFYKEDNEESNITSIR